MHLQTKCHFGIGWLFTPTYFCCYKKRRSINQHIPWTSQCSIRFPLNNNFTNHIFTKIRNEIKKSRVEASDSDIRLFRNSIISSEEKHHVSIRKFTDFYCLEELRDLLFHTQEYQFNLRQVRECLAELKLEFCGFKQDNLVQKFKLTNTGLNDPYDLLKWHSFEENNPGAFIQMYQFWCQKIY